VVSAKYAADSRRGRKEERKDRRKENPKEENTHHKRKGIN
jgi:hypothetical protein